MKPNRRSFLLGGAALGGTTLVACGGQAGQQNTTTNGTTITVGLTYIPNIQFSPFYVAESEGLFKDAGISLTLRHHGTQEGLFTALAACSHPVTKPWSRPQGECLNCAPSPPATGSTRG